MSIVGGAPLHSTRRTAAATPARRARDVQRAVRRFVETVKVLTEFWWKLGRFRLQPKCHRANAICRATGAQFRPKATGGPPSCDFQLHIESSAAGSVNVADVSVVPTRRVFRIGFRSDGYAGSLTATPPLLSTFRQQRAARARFRTRPIRRGRSRADAGLFLRHPRRGATMRWGQSVRLDLFM